MHLCEINRSAQIREVSPTCVSTSSALLASYTQVAREENTFVPGILQDEYFSPSPNKIITCVV